jgi:hypothetical protein
VASSTDHSPTTKKLYETRLNNPDSAMALGALTGTASAVLPRRRSISGARLASGVASNPLDTNPENFHGDFSWLPVPAVFGCGDKAKDLYDTAQLE